MYLGITASYRSVEQMIGNWVYWVQDILFLRICNLFYMAVRGFFLVQGTGQLQGGNW
jgi:hypothetical protein